jgi:hypothetical protein
MLRFVALSGGVALCLSGASEAVLPLSRIAGRMPLFALTETVMALLPASGATVLPLSCSVQCRKGIVGS